MAGTPKAPMYNLFLTSPGDNADWKLTHCFFENIKNQKVTKKHQSTWTQTQQRKDGKQQHEQDQKQMKNNPNKTTQTAPKTCSRDKG